MCGDALVVMGMSGKKRIARLMIFNGMKEGVNRRGNGWKKVGAMIRGAG